jgi:hypothetical protein
MLQSQKYTCKRNLYQLNNQIESTTKLSNYLRMSCGRKRKEIENLCNEITRLEALVTEFKSSNEEYNQIKRAAEEKVKDVLTNGKLLLRFATASVIESLRINPELCNFVSNDISNNNDTTSYGSNYLLLTLPGEQQSSSYISDDIYTVVILEESEKLYNKLVIKLTNEAMAAAAAIKESSLPLPLPII